MKIALAFPGCHRKAGVERVVFECARFLADRNHHVTVLASEWEADRHGTICYRYVPSAAVPAFRRPWSFFRESTRLLDIDADGFDALGTFGCVAPLDGVYWAQSVHAAWMEHSRRLRPTMSLARWRQRLNPVHARLLQLEQKHLGDRRYKKVIALSDEVRSDLQRFYGVPPGDVVLLSNGFSPTEFNVADREQLRGEMRNRLGYHSHHRVIIFVANELERKGFGPLILAIEAIGDPNIRLLAVGHIKPGAYAGEIARRGLTDQVHFTGPTREVARYYAAADVFALPTQYEAWGMVIVEAMACGLPVLTSRLAGAAVTVEEGNTGFLLEDPCCVDEIAGKLQKLLNGEHTSQAEIAESIQAYSWEKILGKYEEILTSHPVKPSTSSGSAEQDSPAHRGRVRVK